MIDIYRNNDYDSRINYFYGRESVKRSELVLKIKDIYGEKYVYAEPVRPGQYAFGGTILFTSNGIYPDFSKQPIKLHDRLMR